MRTIPKALLLGLLTTGCSSSVPDDSVSPATLLQNLEAWDGKTVMVEGWLGTCSGLNCLIHSSALDMEIVKAGVSSRPEWSKAMRRSISIGFNEQFDRAAGPLQFTYVRLRARVNKECWPHNCKDRADILMPISIEPSDPKKAEN